jgi:FlaA1/EpsC-like NDP-sugar epimerase
MNNSFLTQLFLLTRSLKLVVIVFLDFFIILCSSYLSLAIRFDNLTLIYLTDEKYLISLEFFLIPIIVYFSFALLLRFYSLSFRYYNLGSNIYYSFPVIGLIILLSNFLFNEYFSYGAVIINIILLFTLVVISRKLISKIYNITQVHLDINTLIISSSKNLHKIYIYLKLNQKLKIKAICVEDISKIDFTRYQDYKIINIKDVRIVCKKFKIKKIYADQNYKELDKLLVKNISTNIMEADYSFKKINVDYKQQFINEYFKLKSKVKFKTPNEYQNKTILITGAGGSIGKNLFLELLSSAAKKIILVEQDEFKLFNLKKKYESIESDKKNKPNVLFKLGNLSDEFFLKKIFLDDKKIDYVLHAAAYKHVGLGEQNLFSFVKNNILVTYDLAKISIENDIKKFIFISTDKAVNPKSIMGYSKSFCEKVLINLSKSKNLKNIFKIVRFGNVINSDGSVLPIFEDQILKGNPVTVTDKNVTRYFMTISNACQLVLRTIEINKNIGIFILDMGKPYKILDIAKTMINFYRKKKITTINSKILFTGLQHGEKIHEELILGKNLIKTKFKNILFANEKIQIQNNFQKTVFNLRNAYKKNNKKKIMFLLKNNV